MRLANVADTFEMTVWRSSSFGENYGASEVPIPVPGPDDNPLRLTLMFVGSRKVRGREEFVVCVREGVEFVMYRARPPYVTVFLELRDDGKCKAKWRQEDGWERVR